MRKNLLYLALLFGVMHVQAQKYEAENATLSGGAVIQNLSGASNGKIVATQEGELSLNIQKTSQAYFDIYVQASSGSIKHNDVVINGAGTSFVVDNANYTSIKVASFVKFNAGVNTLQIKKSWGWINVDYIELVEVSASGRFNLNQTLVTPNPSVEAVKLYQFLLDNYGKKIISGAMTLNSFDESNWLKQQTGKEPALLGIDFMQTNRGYTWYTNATPINDARTWYNKNGIPAMMWHWRDPSRTTEEFYTKGTTFDITAINTPGSTGYNQMIADIDFVANQLKVLKNDGVPVVWRPLHEAAGGWFWWGAKGAAPCKKLWQVMYDRMVNYHGLNNLIWVWTREPGDDAWYPGDQYVDIIGRDIYKDGDHTSQILEFNSMNDLYGGKKMLALSETGSYPDVDNLKNDLAAWSWYMPWYGDYVKSATYNSLDLWKKMFASEYVITLDEMPNLKTYQTVSAIDSKIESGLEIYPTVVNESVTVKSLSMINSISVVDLLGTEVLNFKQINSNETTINVSTLRAGTYIIVVDGLEKTKLVVR